MNDPAAKLSIFVSRSKRDRLDESVKRISATQRDVHTCVKLLTHDSLDATTNYCTSLVWHKPVEFPRIQFGNDTR